MNGQTLAIFEQVKKLSERADTLRNQGSWEQSSKCYQLVAKKLRAITKEASKVETIDLLKQKIEKYEGLAAQMDAQKDKPKQSRIMSFGFPEMPLRFTLPVGKPKIDKNVSVSQMAPQRNLSATTREANGDVAGLAGNQLKASFDDIVGMTELKEILYEAVIIPQKRPDLFKGIREPPRGILLYGPPGNGKTFITKALAKESGCTFYGLSAGSIVNKFVGETEKTLRKVFESAKQNSPSIIFIDEIDSILTARSESDGDAARRLKTEFLVQFDGLEGCRVILIGATNLPNELDIAALRRFNKLVYVGLPDRQCRAGIIEKTLKDIKYDLSSNQMSKLVKNLEGYSASQVCDVIKQACMMPIREISRHKIETVDVGKIRAVRFEDFQKVLKVKKPLLSKEDLKKYDGKFK